MLTFVDWRAKTTYFGSSFLVRRANVVIGSLNVWHFDFFSRVTMHITFYFLVPRMIVSWKCSTLVVIEFVIKAA